MTNTFRQPPIPAGATADPWYDGIDEGEQIRSLNWSNHDTPKVAVGVDGRQYFSNGNVERFIALYPGGDCDLTANEARQLAAALLNAADTLDGPLAHAGP